MRKLVVRFRVCLKPRSRWTRSWCRSRDRLSKKRLPYPVVLKYAVGIIASAYLAKLRQLRIEFFCICGCYWAHFAPVWTRAKEGRRRSTYNFCKRLKALPIGWLCIANEADRVAGFVAAASHRDERVIGQHAP